MILFPKYKKKYKKVIINVTKILIFLTNWFDKKWVMRHNSFFLFYYIIQIVLFKIFKIVE